jgi:hypothetical protein
MAAWGNYVYVLGGSNGSGLLSSIERALVNADGTLGNWQAMGNLSSAREGLKSVAVNGYLYVVGGRNTSSAVSTVEYAAINGTDGTLGNWQTASSLNTARAYFGLTSANGYIYAIGGSSTSVLTSVEYAAINPNGSLGTWQTTYALNTARHGIDAVSTNGIIYVPSGQNPSGKLSSVEYASIQSNGALSVWQTTSNVITPRVYHAAATDGSNVYILGGSVTSGNESSASVEVAAIKPDGTLNTWQSTTSLQQDKFGVAATVAKGYLYVSGGHRWGTYLTSVEYTKVAGGESTILVRDESENPNPVNGAQVYRNGTLAGTTAADGTLAIPGLSVGDRLVARQRITEVTTPRSGHNQDSTQNWAYRVYITSLDIPASGEPSPFTVTNPAVTQILTLKKSNSLIGFNIVASVEWDANTDYLEELRQGFNLASSYLYDATDGQMLLERVTIYDNAQNWDNADYQLRASNQEWPRANVSGLNSANTYIFLGRYFDGSSANQGSWTNPNGYRTQIHEFGHYGLGLYDSYFYYVDTQKMDGHCTSAAIRTNSTPGINATLMDWQYNATEFAVQGVTGLWSDECENTRQWQVNGSSDWGTIIIHYQDSNAPPRWTMNTPVSHNGVVAGPTSIPVTTWTSAVVGGNANTGICATPPVFQVNDTSGARVPHADVVLNEGSRQIVQGKTSANGEITILGAANGDQVNFTSRNVNLQTNSTQVECTSGQMPQRARSNGATVITLEFMHNKV